MVSAQRVLQLCSLLAIAGTASGRETIIQWGTCIEDFDSALPVDCGRLFVPLDYTNSTSDVTLSLELLRVPAAIQPARGSILLNFGGPGAPGRENLPPLAPQLQALSGGQYNLITFDPRGTGSTIPFTCYDNDFELQLYWDGQSFPDGSDTPALGKLWARGTIDADSCAKNHNGTGRLISTAFVARDMVKVAESLGEDGMVRYWGFSYGTTLGATIVSMFPDKVDKVILDGVQNPHDYYHSYADFEGWAQSDEVFSEIFIACAANPDECPLARRDKTAADLERAVWDLFETMKQHPIPVGQIIIGREGLQGMVASSLYSPIKWKNITAVLDMFLTGNIDEKFVLEVASETILISQKDLPSVAGGLKLEGIHCLDRAARARTYENFQPAIDRLFNTSRIMGGASMPLSMACAQWKMDPKERYEGDFRVRPRNPVLIVGNTHDGHTSIRSAHNVSAGFEGSVVLEVNGFAHTSIHLPSWCSLRTVSSYWFNGTLPKPGTVCQVDSPPFSKITWADIIKTAGSDTSLSKRSFDYEAGLGRWRPV